MIIKDLLHIVPVEKLVDIMIEHYGDEPEYREKAIIAYGDLFSRLKEKEPVDTGFIALGVNLIDEFEEDDVYIPSVFIMKKAEVLAADLDKMNVLNRIIVDECTDMGIIKALNLVKFPDSYAIEFNPWDEIIGIEVDENNVNEYGAENILAYIINELTFFGFEEEDKNVEEEKLLEVIKESEEIRSLPEEEQNKYFISADELFNKWGFSDDRTKEEKEAEERKMRRRYLKNCISEYKVLKKYKERLCE